MDRIGSDQLSDLKGVLSQAVPECICLVLFLVCLVGLPPLPGFIGKFALVGVAIRHQWYFLSGVAILSIAIMTVAIARLSFSLVGDFSSARGSQATVSGFSEEHSVVTARRTYLAALFIPMILVGIFAELVLSGVGQSLRFILW
jgi:NADH:ubiquinone oxidoreductase subunit 2 (subunit N)